MKRHYFNSALAGFICGILSTYPVELRFLPAIIFWGVVGAGIGWFTQGKQAIVRSGVAYGIFLAIGFLFSRFGGTARQIPSYTLFVSLASIGSIGGGIFSVFIGSKLKKFFHAT